MTPDHDAAKELAEAFAVMKQNEYGPECNLGHAYLDLLYREQRAEELLRELLDTAKPEPGTDYQTSIWARSYAYLAERGGEV